MNVAVRDFGTSKTGKPVSCWTLTNGNGMEAEVLDWGCVVRCIRVPDRDGAATDVVLGYDDIAGYESGSCFYGAFVGRYANRIRNAEFSLNGKTYKLEKNDGSNHLHGIYCTTVFAGGVEGDELVLRHSSPDGEEGYPGALELEVRYALTEQNGLKMTYLAKAKGDTVINLTNHSYFNLAGEGDIFDHELQLNCDRYTESGTDTTPTGRVLSVEGTALDFRSPRKLGEVLGAGCPLLTPFKGCDHNLIFSDGQTASGWAYCPRSGIRMDMETTQPAVQLYTGNYIPDDTAASGKNGVRYPIHAGFCLETQHYPSSPNFDNFPSTILRDGETYRQMTEYRFSVK